MKLTRLRVENHRRLSDLEIEVREHLVLVGANDVGKSSLLRCLDLLLGASTAQLYSRISADDFGDADQPLVIEARLTDFTRIDQSLFPDEIHYEPATDSSWLIVRLTATIDDNQTISIERAAPEGGTNRQLSRDQLVGLGWKYLSAANQTRDLREDRRSTLDDILKTVDLGAEKKEFEAIATSLADTLSGSTTLETLRASLAEQLSKALPQPIIQDDLSFIPGAAADDDPLSDVRLQVSKNGIARNLSEQSDGTRALYAMALYDLMSAGANVVGIDEPEIHLHPTSQRSLARLLKSNPNQKIIATHSSDIVSAFDADSIVVVRAGGEVVQPTEGFLSADEKLVVRWWVRDRLEPLTSRRVLAVEGPSDRIVVERAADLTNRNLDRLGVSIVEAGSKTAMPSVEKLFGLNGFRVPLSQLVDEDAEADTAKRFAVDAADLPDHSVWVSRIDLEDEYVRALGASTVWTALGASTMFTPKQLRMWPANGPGGTHTESDVASFCRKRKVEAAIVVASILTEATAQAIKSVEDILQEAATV
ncbi:AAA family ATPase [Rhodococcus fascians]|uniref:ATP-dependent nuclease n=1 Tax=Rhodococcoides fascians TaxID=1828 RepID=UPI001427AE4E|nr:AAA family ATPase [Rhodococcus fascians]MBM7242703.1 AAA family ATPase [Rhodococcus fascians]MBY3809201.1 AAA family ATPase [Rhodococcus fascians]MBY3840851.1 AAA family ATPase [Rhodococcus fascians]MBY3846372.1 AAA family ATPase [Rhodococcus fascians]MBY3851057.1 AAA family ATPase [Rhodococcus fascians]